jgi:hypothetical protein
LVAVPIEQRQKLAGIMDRLLDVTFLDILTGAVVGDASASP